MKLKKPHNPNTNLLVKREEAARKCQEILRKAEAERIECAEKEAAAIDIDYDQHNESNRIWFTADTHFGHFNIIRNCNRPFISINEMDDHIINNINSVVKKNDTLYHLGDWSWSKPETYRERVSCKNVHLILGNHDYRSLKELYPLFSSVKDFLFLKIDHNNSLVEIALMHYAMRIWPKKHYGSYHLYGHSHNTLPEIDTDLSFDVGVDCHSYKPLSLGDVIKRMSKKNKGIFE